MTGLRHHLGPYSHSVQRPAASVADSQIVGSCRSWSTLPYHWPTMSVPGIVCLSSESHTMLPLLPSPQCQPWPCASRSQVSVCAPCPGQDHCIALASQILPLSLNLHSPPTKPEVSAQGPMHLKAWTLL